MREPWDPAARAEADEHDHPATTRDHRALRDEPRHGPGRVHREPVHRAPAVRRDLLRRGRELLSGAVDEQVDGAEPVEGRVDERFDLIRLAHIRGDGEAGDTHRLDRCLHGGERFLPPAADDD